MWKFRSLKRLVAASACVVGVGCAGVAAWNIHQLRSLSVVNVSAETEDLNKSYPDRMYVPSRADLMARLKSESFDVLVIGGGATGAGVALDSQTRGLNTALVEMYDYSSGTSSRSTKLIHGGVRYLQAAVMGLDREQYRLVEEALSERANLLAIAPHLAYPLPILLPVKEWWLVPYYWAGVKTYDLVSGRQRLASSYFISKEKSLELFPMIKQDISGALIYYDGGQDDARTCLSIILTAIRFGTAALNHVAVTQLVKKKDEKTKKIVVAGAKCRDLLNGEEFFVSAKCVVNATGPFTDTVRGMDDSAARAICQPSSGVHITLPGYFSPSNIGLLDPSTSDGRVVFFLPWQGHTIAGTTDEHCTIENGQYPSEAAVDFLIREIQNQLNDEVIIRRGDVLSVWSGIRPLVRDPNAKDTKSIARNHIIEVSPSKLITIAGGKWTTYRQMAEETVDRAIAECDLQPSRSLKSRTLGLKLEGGHKYSPTQFIKLVQDYGMSPEIAENLARTYGDKAFRVARRCGLTGYKWPLIGNRLHPGHPFVDGQVVYAVQREYTCTAVDVIARRLRIAFLNADNANEILENVVQIMAKYLNWDRTKMNDEVAHARRFLRREMGLDLATKDLKKQGSVLLESSEEERYRSLFKIIDKEKKGFLTMADIKKMFREHNGVCERVSTDKLSEIISEVNTDKNGQISQDEFLRLIYKLKSGDYSTSRFAMAAKLIADNPNVIPPTIQSPTDVNRSGGGL